VPHETRPPGRSHLNLGEPPWTRCAREALLTSRWRGPPPPRGPAARRPARGGTARSSHRGGSGARRLRGALRAPRSRCPDSGHPTPRRPGGAACPSPGAAPSRVRARGASGGRPTQPVPLPDLLVAQHGERRESIARRSRFRPQAHPAGGRGLVAATQPVCAGDARAGNRHSPGRRHRPVTIGRASDGIPHVERRRRWGRETEGRGRTPFDGVPGHANPGAMGRCQAARWRAEPPHDVVKSGARGAHLAPGPALRTAATSGGPAPR